MIVVVEENHSAGQIIGSANAPLLNQLARRGVLLTDYFAITHPSLPNYIALLGGDTHGLRTDCVACHVDAPNLVDQLEGAHISWKAYMQGLPRPCSDAAGAGAYAKKHDPFMYFDSIRYSPARCAKVVPFEQFLLDLAQGRLPRFAFITPDLEHDMHDGPVAAADAWVGLVHQRLASSPAWRQDTRLVVTFDEGGGRGAGAACCHGLARGGRVATIIAGPRVEPGRDPATYTHYSLLASIESLFGLPRLGHAADPATAAIRALAAPATARHQRP